MTKNDMIQLLNDDLKNEWMHLRFYLFHASQVVGLHCSEYKELLLEHAQSEMKHITEFSDMIIGLGGCPTEESNQFFKYSEPKDIISYALEIESNVVKNYVERIKQAQELGGVDGQWLEIFLEKQVEHSREDVDHFKQILRGL